jgi:anti-anti-sigma regulatory factor
MVHVCSIATQILDGKNEEDLGKTDMQTVTIELQRPHQPHTSGHIAPLRITARGDLTNDARVLELNRACIAAIGRPTDRLIVDVSDVTNSDTKLVAVLVSLYANCRRKGIEVRMRLSQGIVNWLGVYDLTWLAKVCDPDAVG